MKYVRYRSCVLIACAFLACQVQTSPAADEAEGRTIRFVLADEPYVTDMPEPPDALLRYTAIVHGFAPLLISDPGDEPRPLDMPGLSVIAQLDFSRSGSRLREMMNVPWHRFHAKLIDDYPAEIVAPPGPHLAVRGSLANMVTFFRGAHGLPPKDVMADFWQQFVPARQAARPPLQEYFLLARSAEEAKQFATDFLHAYDRGYVPWLEKLVRRTKADSERSRDKAEPKLAEIDKKIDSLAKEVEGVEELGEQAISDLKVKRTLLKVELAGVEARLKVIDDKLKAGASSGFASKLGELKVTDEIERASLEAQQRVLDELIDGQRQLQELDALRRDRRQYAAPVETASQAVPRCDEVLADLKPFELIEDTVVIRPLKFRSE